MIGRNLGAYCGAVMISLAVKAAIAFLLIGFVIGSLV